jgi:hypothetical protein
VSQDLTRRQSSAPARQRRRPGRNLITFPRELRDAIPDLPTCVGRALELSEMDAHFSDTPVYGRRVHLRFTVCETGKLKGRFAVRVDLHPDAARGLAETLARVLEESPA